MCIKIIFPQSFGRGRSSEVKGITGEVKVLWVYAKDVHRAFKK